LRPDGATIDIGARDQHRIAATRMFSRPDSSMLDVGARDGYRIPGSGIRTGGSRLSKVFARLTSAALALTLSLGAAQAVVGGRTETGPLARTSVMVLSSRGGVCTGVVIAPDVVLTAAHCVTAADAFRVHFRDPDGEPVMIEPIARALHPGFDPKAIAARRRSIDLALLRIPDALPERFESAVLSSAAPPRDAEITVGGYGLAREGAPKSMGTFRSAPLRAAEPFGPSRILVWAEGSTGTGACQGDSGGPLFLDGRVFAVTSWSEGAGRAHCGARTQGILLGPQRDWIDGVLKRWERQANWN
jgi:hypothetical protein